MDYFGHRSCDVPPGNYFSGKDNRLLLAKYVSYNDPCKILSVGLNTNTDNISDLINLFNLSITNDVNNVKENLAQYVFDTVIPRNIRLAEAPSHGMPITEYDPRSIGAKSYINLAKELIKKNKN